MANPVILTVDDEPQVLNAIERDLRRKYGRDYRIIKAGSGEEALNVAKQLKQRGDPLALFLADQRMPNVSGTEFLDKAREFYPEARKVLLTAYADTEAAISSINEIGLDYYMMKPWDPPDQNMYPILDELLDDWQATVPVLYDGIRVAGTLWSASSHAVKDFLATNRIPYQWLDIEKDPEARALVDSVSKGQTRLPVVFFPDGTVLIDPDNLKLAESCGLQTEAKEKFYDVIIIGGGPSGLGAAVYGASEGLRTVLIEKHATGGQAGTSSFIENYLGFPKGLTGADLARRATAQAQRFGTEILTAQEVVKVRVEDPYKIVTLGDGSELSCLALIVATGVDVRKLNLPGIDKITGAGVYYGEALTEAAHFSGQPVFVVGGANSAGQDAMFFSRYASKVTMLVREGSLDIMMSQYLVDQINDTPNIDVLTHRQVVEVHGEQRLEAITIKNHETGELEKMQASAVFLFIGAVSHTEMLDGVVERNSAGFILTGDELMREGKHPKGWKLKRDPYLLETNVPGIFSVGDVRAGAMRRVASAVGQGSMAIGFVHQYLKTV